MVLRGKKPTKHQKLNTHWGLVQNLMFANEDWGWNACQWLTSLMLIQMKTNIGNLGLHEIFYRQWESLDNCLQLVRWRLMCFMFSWCFNRPAQVLCSFVGIPSQELHTITALWGIWKAFKPFQSFRLMIAIALYSRRQIGCCITCCGLITTIPAVLIAEKPPEILMGILAE